MESLKQSEFLQKGSANGTVRHRTKKDKKGSITPVVNGDRDETTVVTGWSGE